MYGRGWTTLEMRIARDLRLSGHTYSQIGERLGRPPNSIKSFLLRNRIMPPREVKHATMLRASIKREEAKKDISYLVVKKVVVPAHVIANRDRRADEYHPPFGDPPFSQSALAASPAARGLVQSRESLRDRAPTYLDPATAD